MALTELTWEEVSQYTPIENPSHMMLFEHDGKYFEVIEVGIASVRKVFDFDSEALNAYLSGEKTAHELSFNARNGVWPPKVTQDEANRIFLKNNIALLQDDADNQRLFTKDELKELLPEGSKILASKD